MARRQGWALPPQYVRTLFCPLTRSGPMFEAGQIWGFDNNGNTRPEGPADVRAILGVRCETPEGYRSQSYWVLPTRLDALWIEHDHLYRRRAHEMTPEQMETLTVINWIHALALGKAGIGDPPKWWTTARRKVNAQAPMYAGTSERARR